MELFQRQGISPREIRLTGGGARSPRWRQIVADVMNCPVVCLQVKETAALGGAIQAMWATALAEEPHQQADGVLSDLCQRFVSLDESTRAAPDARRQPQYDALYQRYLQRLQQAYPEASL